MYFAPASVIEMPFVRFSFEATSALCSMITAPCIDTAKSISVSYQFSNELENLIPSLIASSVDITAIHAYLNNIENIESADIQLEYQLVLMILLRLMSITEDKDSYSLLHNLAMAICDRAE